MLPGVDAYVIRETCPSCESLMAEVAAKRFLPGVGALVYLEVMFQGETFVAGRTGKICPTYGDVGGFVISEVVFL